ncbi:sensor histidine kinase [Parabacteroides sp. FAFU027]|uniref:sensor histidine kinase n=1 Tax=Parabacteroides sp. FAFU027 TaxID=2922715 RepID=UPI001FAF6985|nr:HAMP domain-containing sensor histidine kinase [Parabacteroides sp. FAFU027]
MHSIYENRQKGTIIIVGISISLVSIFLYFSRKLVDELAHEERNKVEIWAEAMRILSSDSNEGDIPLILKVLQSNRTIPVVLIDEKDNVITYKNIDIPTKDSAAFMKKEVQRLKAQDNKIIINLSEANYQYLYYDDSILLKKLNYYPFVQLLVMTIFLLVVYFAVRSAKRAEQNQLWVGLSKETAHQLGTPISSLMAWTEFLRMKNVDENLLQDMSKDVNRLKIIADRFSKIGSKPEIIPVDIVPTLQNATNYINKRTSAKVKIETFLPNEPIPVCLCVPLFEWVVENLCKNAIDAMDGVGYISITMKTNAEGMVIIDVSDTGKGIPKSKFKTIFRPGFTTKARGWGLGLTLVKRIIEEYHEGKIYVKSSEINKGTTFRIELKAAN